MVESARPSILHRVGVIGDVHCEDEKLRIALRHFASMRVDAVLAVGDIVDGQGDVNRACNLMADEGVLAVMGNHDRWFLDGRLRDLPGATPQADLNESARAWLQNLPKTRSFQTSGGSLLLCHGMAEDDMNRVYPDTEGYELESNLALSNILKAKEYRFVINGHTHEPMVRRIQRLVIINGGSLCGQERPVCSVVDFDENSVQFFEISTNEVILAERVVLGKAASSSHDQ